MRHASVPELMVVLRQSCSVFPLEPKCGRAGGQAAERAGRWTDGPDSVLSDQTDGQTWGGERAGRADNIAQVKPDARPWWSNKDSLLVKLR